MMLHVILILVHLVSVMETPVSNAIRNVQTIAVEMVNVFITMLIMTLLPVALLPTLFVNPNVFVRVAIMVLIVV